MDYKALHQISYGLFAITSKSSKGHNGYIGNTVFQITSQPPRLAISTNRENYTHQFISESGVFAISLLEQEVPKSTIQTFGYKSGLDTDKFSDVEYQEGNNGCRILTEGIASSFECKVIDKLDVGTHTIFIGEVTDMNVMNSKARVMTYEYYHDVFKGMAPPKAPTFINESLLKKEEDSNDKEVYVCSLCGYEYDADEGDPSQNVAEGTLFADLPHEWLCPICGAEKELFSKR